MLVRATRTGFFGHKRIKEGQVFKITPLKVATIDPKTKEETFKTIKVEEQFSEDWMEKIDEKEARREKTPVVRFEQNDNVEPVI